MQISLLLAHEIAQLFLILLAGFVLVRCGPPTARCCR